MKEAGRTSEGLESEPQPSPVTIAGRTLTPTAVFNTYWKFAVRRQALYMKRLDGDGPPWTKDEILEGHRFTNVFRASDRVSQYLICEVQRSEPQVTELVDQVFRTLLFKIFNREDTWKALEAAVGPISWSSYSFEAYAAALASADASGPIYSAAYLMPPPKLGESKKYANHLRLLERMIGDGLVGKVLTARSLKEVYEALLAFPAIGPFLAFQYAIDLNYLDELPYDEDDFVVAGPGAKDGIRKCFGPASKGLETEIIRYMVDSQEEHFTRLDLSFPGLFGRRLHLIDAQNLFCEVDKYARVAHPEAQGLSGRTRIKQLYRPGGPVARPRFPERWHLQVPPTAPGITSGPSSASRTSPPWSEEYSDKTVGFSDSRAYARW